MLFEDTYKTISGTSTGAFRDRGSRFDSYAFPVRSEEQAKEILQKVKAEHPKADHHCWALRLTTDRSVFRINDDGEPSGTAGRPILNTLLSSDLTDILVVVVRYFGGIQLGVPGLIKAYKTACAEAIANGQIIEKTLEDIYELRFDFSKLHEVMKVIKDNNLRILEQRTDNQCVIRTAISKTFLNSVLEKLKNINAIGIKFLMTN